jgi:hypothetical protein
MFKLNCRVWCFWTYTTRALKLPVVVKIKYDLNKKFSMFKVNYPYLEPLNFPHSRSWTARSGKN